jgi:hypothetical protein
MIKISVSLVDRSFKTAEPDSQSNFNRSVEKVYPDRQIGDRLNYRRGDKRRQFVTESRSDPTSNVFSLFEHFLSRPHAIERPSSPKNADDSNSNRTS